MFYIKLGKEIIPSHNCNCIVTVTLYYAKYVQKQELNGMKNTKQLEAGLQHVSNLAILLWELQVQALLCSFCHVPVFVCIFIFFSLFKIQRLIFCLCSQFKMNGFDPKFSTS